MPIKSYGRGSAPEIHRWPGGLTWLAHPDEDMRRASHALAVDDDGRLSDDPSASDANLWLVEPIDVAGLDAVSTDGLSVTISVTAR